MSNKKPSFEGQMGSGESDDEFYNVKLPNTSTVNEGKEPKNVTDKKGFSPPRTKVKYDYKFESSSDDDSDGASSGKKSKTEMKDSAEQSCKEKKADKLSSDNNKLPQSTSKVVEKINEVLKNMKQDGSNKAKTEVSSASGSSNKHIPTSGVGVAAPVVVVPPPMLVQPPHLAMGPTGMLVPSAIGIANQNVMVSPTNMIGNVIRPAAVGSLMGVGNPNMINPIQTQGNVLGMTNDILQLQGNIMGLHGNLMQIPGSVAGMCMTGIPVQTALQGNIVGMQAPGSNIIASQGSIIGNPSNMLTNPGGVLMNPAIAVPNLINNQGSIIGNVGNVMGTPGNLLLNMNNLVSHQGSRVNYPGNVLSAQTMNSVGSRNSLNDVSKNQVNYTENQTKTDHEWHGAAKSLSSSDKVKASSKSPSPSDSDSKNEDGDEEDVSPYESSRSVREVPNTFKNDGSFMELFKKMSEANSKGSSNKDESPSVENSETDSSNIKRPPVMLSGIVGKRRGGRVLKTGLVKKVKKESDSEEEKAPKDAWAMYMAEVKKYREASCEEEGKTRPLVK